MQRAAQKSDRTADRLAAGQAADCLVDDRLDNGGRQIFLGSAFVDQGLDVGFGKNAAAGRDRVYCLIICRILIKTGGVGLQQGGHLVDKGAGAAGADPVHTLVDPAGKVDDFGVLSA